MTTIARLRTKHSKGMMILPNSSRTYVECKHCPGTQLDPKYLFGCSCIACILYKIDINCNMDIVHKDKVKAIVKTVVNAFGSI